MRTRKDFDNAKIGDSVLYEDKLVKVVNKSPIWIVLNTSEGEVTYIRRDWLPEELPEKKVLEERYQTKNVEESLASFNKAVEEHLEREAELKYREGVKKIFEFKWQCGDRVSYTSAVARKCSRAKRKVRRFVERCYNEKVTKISLVSVSDLLK